MIGDWGRTDRRPAYTIDIEITGSKGPHNLEFRPHFLQLYNLREALDQFANYPLVPSLTSARFGAELTDFGLFAGITPLLSMVTLPKEQNSD